MFLIFLNPIQKLQSIVQKTLLIKSCLETGPFIFSLKSVIEKIKKYYSLIINTNNTAYIKSNVSNTTFKS